jgi:hypothetical protein
MQLSNEDTLIPPLAALISLPFAQEQTDIQGLNKITETLQILYTFVY